MLQTSANTIRDSWKNYAEESKYTHVFRWGENKSLHSLEIVWRDVILLIRVGYT